jgi:hypothetical protein
MTDIATLYNRYVALYGAMEAPGHTDGEAATERLCELETAIAATPAITQAERNLKSVIATLAERASASGQAVLASLESDYAQVA